MQELHSKFLFAWDGRAIKRIQSVGPRAHSSAAILSVWQSEQTEPPRDPLFIPPVLQGHSSQNVPIPLIEISDWGLWLLKKTKKPGIFHLLLYLPVSICAQNSSLLLYLFWSGALWRHCPGQMITSVLQEEVHREPFDREAAFHNASLQPLMWCCFILDKSVNRHFYSTLHSWFSNVMGLWHLCALVIPIIYTADLWHSLLCGNLTTIWTVLHLYVKNRSTDSTAMRYTASYFSVITQFIIPLVSHWFKNMMLSHLHQISPRTEWKNSFRTNET